MPQTSNEPDELDARQRTRDQLGSMQELVGEANLAWDSDDAADHNFLFIPERILVDDDNRAAFDDAFAARAADFLELDLEVAPQEETRGEPIDGLVTYRLPQRLNGRDPRPTDVLDALRIYDEELGPGVATPEHFVHLAGTGNGRACPATEPAETGLSEPWPPAVTDPAVGQGVEVVVIDTGWQPTGPQLAEYDGHGLFAESVLRCRAPGAKVRTLEFDMERGTVSEYVLARLLGQALDMTPTPQVINISAGCHTRHDQPFVSFERVWRNRPPELRDQVVVVAAAGNDSTFSPFYPAASPWAIGVGSLDHDGRVSSFSNYRQSADVFILGRNHVNAFPDGTYVCRWTPNIGDERVFDRGLARWSGTSFAAPLLAGLIAAHIPGFDGTPPQAARDLVRQLRTWRRDPLYGDHRVIELPRFV